MPTFGINFFIPNRNPRFFYMIWLDSEFWVKLTYVLLTYLRIPVVNIIGVLSYLLTSEHSDSPFQSQNVSTCCLLGTVSDLVSCFLSIKKSHIFQVEVSVTAPGGSDMKGKITYHGWWNFNTNRYCILPKNSYSIFHKIFRYLLRTHGVDRHFWRDTTINTATATSK